jgi:hypothetical protein
VIHFQLACYHALAGDPEAALDPLERACAGDPRAKTWARDDHDFDSIRDGRGSGPRSARGLM